MADSPVQDTKRGSSESRAPGLAGVLTFLTLSLVVAALYFAREVLVPFALAVLLSFLLAPAVRGLRRLRAGRVTAVAATVLVAFVAIFAFAAIVTEEISLLGPELPTYRHNIEAKLRAFPKAIPLQRVAGALHGITAELKRSETPAPTPVPASPATRNAAAEAPKPLPVEVVQPDLTPLQIGETVIGPMLQPLAMAGLVIVMVIFILLEREELRDRLLRLAGAGDLHRTTEAMNEAAQRVSRYLLSQLLVNAVEGTLIGIGLALIGIPNAALWGILVMLLRFIPYLGIVIAACFPLALAIAVDPGWALVAWTALLFITTELIVANIVEPRLYAGSTGLSSIAVITSAVFWTWLWGPIGLLLSTPLTACLLVLGRHVPRLRFLDVLLGSEPVLTPEETFYQRLLANDPEEATEQAEEFAKERSLDAFLNEVAIPVLIRAQADSDAGILPAERRAVVRDGFAAILENLFDDHLIAPENLAKDDDLDPEKSPIVCVAGRNELDEAAAMILAGQLRAHGHKVRIFAADASPFLNGIRPALREAALVCLVLISTSSPARAQHIVRRLRRRAPWARLVLGLWGGHTDGILPDEARRMSAADAVVMSLPDTVGDIEEHIAAPQPLLAAGGEGAA